ncbi:hypothetical protein CBOM_05440 [Ceraceosorus bombacis]|uniref:Uncharacterized protein n=1 Tax=Ceraceosorus bombacis TaxID=401625 RepID=A0A0P1BPB0_9BASI|nr:hypothetical protein CBOM_05440 [Ceraceosorus bombacis]
MSTRLRERKLLRRDSLDLARRRSVGPGHLRDVTPVRPAAHMYATSSTESLPSTLNGERSEASPADSADALERDPLEDAASSSAAVADDCSPSATEAEQQPDQHPTALSESETTASLGDASATESPPLDPAPQLDLAFRSAEAAFDADVTSDLTYRMIAAADDSSLSPTRAEAGLKSSDLLELPAAFEAMRLALQRDNQADLDGQATQLRQGDLTFDAGAFLNLDASVVLPGDSEAASGPQGATQLDQTRVEPGLRRVPCTLEALADASGSFSFGSPGLARAAVDPNSDNSLLNGLRAEVDQDTSESPFALTRALALEQQGTDDLNPRRGSPWERRDRAERLVMPHGGSPLKQTRLASSPQEARASKPKVDTATGHAQGLPSEQRSPNKTAVPKAISVADALSMWADATTSSPTKVQQAAALPSPWVLGDGSPRKPLKVLQRAREMSGSRDSPSKQDDRSRGAEAVAPDDLDAQPQRSSDQPDASVTSVPVPPAKEAILLPRMGTQRSLRGVPQPKGVVTRLNGPSARLQQERRAASSGERQGLQNETGKGAMGITVDQATSRPAVGLAASVKGVAGVTSRAGASSRLPKPASLAASQGPSKSQSSAIPQPRPKGIALENASDGKGLSLAKRPAERLNPARPLAAETKLKSARPITGVPKSTSKAPSTSSQRPSRIAESKMRATTAGSELLKADDPTGCTKAGPIRSESVASNNSSRSDSRVGTTKPESRAEAKVSSSATLASSVASRLVRPVARAAKGVPVPSSSPIRSSQAPRTVLGSRTAAIASSSPLRATVTRAGSRTPIIRDARLARGPASLKQAEAPPTEATASTVEDVSRPKIASPLAARTGPVVIRDARLAPSVVRRDEPAYAESTPPDAASSPERGTTTTSSVGPTEPAGLLTSTAQGRARRVPAGSTEATRAPASVPTTAPALSHAIQVVSSPVPTPAPASPSRSAPAPGAARFGFQGLASPTRRSSVRSATDEEGVGYVDALTATRQGRTPFGPAQATATDDAFGLYRPDFANMSPMKAAKRATLMGDGAPSSDGIIGSSDTGKSLRPRAAKHGSQNLSEISKHSLGVSSAATSALSTKAFMASDSWPSVPLSNAEMLALTKHNTRRNEKYLTKLDIVPIRMEGPRPPSPSAKIRKTPGADKLDKAEADEARERRARKRTSDGADDGQAKQDASAALEKHVQGAGDEESFHTPTRPQFITHGPQKKVVKWHKSLFVGPSEAPAQRIAEAEQRPAAGTRRECKSRSSLSAKSYTLDDNGNVAETEAPISPRLRKTRVKILKLIFDDDL